MFNKTAISYAFLLLGVTISTPTLAAQESVPAKEAREAPAEAKAADEFDTSGKLTGDWGGKRTYLHNHGLDIDATENVEVIGNVSGGLKRGGLVEGRLELDANLDLEKMAGLNGLTAFASAYQLHGNGLTNGNLGNLMVVSNIEAQRATRLYDAWLQQSLFGDAANIRIGQLAADDEFATSENAGLFISSVWGWPATFANNLPDGANAFPLATPGVRLHVGGEDAPWMYMIGVFDGAPAHLGDATQTNPSGTLFNMNRGAFIINELAYMPKTASGLKGTYKVGAWYHTENALDQRYDNTGLSLANAGSTGLAEAHHGNYGFYGVVDKALWREAGTEDQGISAFSRFFWNPENRNVAVYQLDAGINVKGMLPHRDDDVFGVAFSYLRISDRARDYDRDLNVNGTPTPIRDYESEIEVTYKAKITPWLDLQPDFQYVMHPGGHVADTAGNVVKDAAIFGLRATVRF